ncbi:hypothetical protein A2T80_019560 [Aphanizomenon flos-aquae UKL13-PB]|nr:hypothetical protein [Aphanizomenon flos-aquae UKL13-PB]
MVNIYLVSCQLLVVSCQLSGGGEVKKLPITNYQLPITHYPLPITYYPVPSP